MQVFGGEEPVEIGRLKQKQKVGPAQVLKDDKENFFAYFCCNLAFE